MVRKPPPSLPALGLTQLEGIRGHDHNAWADLSTPVSGCETFATSGPMPDDCRSGSLPVWYKRCERCKSPILPFSVVSPFPPSSTRLGNRPRSASSSASRQGAPSGCRPPAVRIFHSMGKLMFDEVRPDRIPCFRVPLQCAAIEILLKCTGTFAIITNKCTETFAIITNNFR